MAEIIRMPRMSDTMEEGVIVGWLKKVGDPVEPGDVLAEVETDKATMELENYHEGVLLHIGVPEGPVPVNGILAVIGEAGEDFQAALQAASEDNGNAAAPAEEAAPASESNETVEAPSPVSPTENPTAAPSTGDNPRIKASPLARSIAEEAGVNLANVQGTGDNGRIIKRDIEAFLKNAASAPAPTPSPSPSPKTEEAAPAVAPFIYGGGEDQFEEIRVSQMRKVIARRLGESKFSAPHFYLTINIDMAKAIETRKRINEIAPTRISFND
ncbi:MAG: biotin/lipoyl-containing protein, partial [Bacteroidota bacterium]